MKLNKLQRHTAYIIMLSIAENRKDYFPISGLYDIYNEMIGELPYCNENKNGRHGKHAFECYLPELWDKRTTDRWLQCWFNMSDKYNWRKRIELLKQCIEETY